MIRFSTVRPMMTDLLGRQDHDKSGSFWKLLLESVFLFVYIQIKGSLKL
jgi:hypothetical protein